jgi:hypothetical protein
MLRKAGSALLRTSLPWRRSAALPVGRFTGHKAAYENRSNEPGPILKRPDRPMDTHKHGPVKLVGQYGPVKNMDVKTSVDELSSACAITYPFRILKAGSVTLENK